MSLRLEMLQVARLAPNVLGDSAPLVRQFLLGQLNSDGGFRNRSGESDIYYTVFGIEGLLALQADFPVKLLASFLKKFGSGENCDFVHLCCLARCWADLKTATANDQDFVPAGCFQSIAERLGKYRSLDGGFYPEEHSEYASAYACFLALGAYQDCCQPVPDIEKVAAAVTRLAMPDGGFANERCTPVGATNATAAAATVLRFLRMPPPSQTARWLMDRFCPSGGFLAVPRAPIPDLLSTATALHALAGLNADFGKIKEPCLDFVDSLWSNAGGFHGHWGDDHLDCEYTYYGLLALGHLSL